MSIYLLKVFEDELLQMNFDEIMIMLNAMMKSEIFSEATNFGSIEEIDVIFVQDRSLDVLEEEYKMFRIRTEKIL